ncbi:Vitamin K-dependent gamma-carboxylase [Symmachiella dynata]|uniref:HTTM domain-containing protein n=1 Tax=Symmachiella dynata TaxID=2527995 RepID=UPI001188CA8B|nr:HTTM domain-containing protein [Symmachiella dynata]QDT46941.1 Vitamin K-dependent gamma-carboxylase [Symmachiella dynata]
MNETQVEQVAKGDDASSRFGGGQRWGFLFAPVDIASIVFFRILFGGIMLWHVSKYYRDDMIAFYYIKPPFHLTFYGLEWIRPWPGDLMYLHFAVMGVAACLVLIGWFYRAATIVLFLTFTHQFLIEKSLYQNHYYLMALISFLMIFIPAHRAFSVDALFRPKAASQTIPAWTLWLLRIQLGIVYFYGGLAKINVDWLHGWPMRIWLRRHTDFPVLGDYVHQEWCVVFFTYGGLLFDLLVVPMLLWKRTRMFAFMIAISFHLLNSQLFSIGVFPWFMIGATLIYFSPSWPRTLVYKLLWIPGRRPLPAAAPDKSKLTSRQKLTVALLGVYLTLQIVVPFRHFLYPQSESWTEEGHFFAWHMMLREKLVGLRFYATNPQTGNSGSLDIRPYVTERQIRRLGKDPDMILDFVHFLHGELLKQGNEEIEIRVLALAALNGRKPQPLVDPTIDLTQVPRTLFHQKEIIVPLTEPLREEAWEVPLLDWEQHPDLAKYFTSEKR